MFLGAGMPRRVRRPSVRKSVPAAQTAQTAMEAVASGLSAGQWGEVTGITGLSASMFIAGATKTYDYCNKMAYDPIGLRFLWIGQGHEQRQDWYQYDEESNTFSVLSDPPWDDGGSSPPTYLGHGFQHNVVDTATGDFYYRMTGSGTVRRWTRSSETWDTIAAAQTSGNAIGGSLEWLPEIGTSGGLISLYGEYLQRWTKSSDSWSTVSSSIANPQNHTIAHYNSVDGLVYVGGGNGDSNALYSVGAAGSQTALDDCPISMGVTMSITACCPTSGDLLVIESNASAQKWDGASWAALSMTGAPSFGTVAAGSGILSAAVPAYGVVAYLFCQAEELWLYKHA